MKASHRSGRSAHEAALEGAPGLAVQLRLTGAPHLTYGTGPIHELERHAAALLALLALEGPTLRRRAAALLWSDADAERQRSSLRQRLFHLRRQARCDVIPAGDVLALAPGIQHDLSEIGARLVDDPDAGSDELLGDLDSSDCADLDDWVRRARERVRTARLEALAIAGPTRDGIRCRRRACPRSRTTGRPVSCSIEQSVQAAMTSGAGAPAPAPARAVGFLP